MLGAIVVTIGAAALVAAYALALWVDARHATKSGKMAPAMMSDRT
jgi:hypothetical protein